MVMGDDIVNQQQEYMYYNDGDQNGNSFDFFNFTSVPPFNFTNLQQNVGGRPPSPGTGGGTGDQKSPLV